MMPVEQKMKRLLMFNLATDAENSALGFAISWIAELAKHVAAIDVITMYAGKYDLPEHVRVYSVGKEKGYSEPRRFLEFYRILFRLLRQHRYDGCFAHMMPLFAAMAAPILRLKKIPIVLWYAHKSATPVLRLATFFAQRVVTSVKEGFPITTSKCHVIGQGIATERFAPREDVVQQSCPFTLLMVGRISQIKRIDLLVNAVDILRQRAPEIHFRILLVGAPLTEQDQAYAASIERQISQKQLENFTVMTGSVPFEKILPYYHEADCCVNLCPNGAIDKVVLEAMSCGVIPLVTNLSFQAVFGEKLVALCLIEDEPEQIATRISAIYSLSQETRRAIGAELRAIVVNNHSLSVLCQKVLHECAMAQQAFRKKSDGK